MTRYQRYILLMLYLISAGNRLFFPENVSGQSSAPASANVPATNTTATSQVATPQSVSRAIPLELVKTYVRLEFEWEPSGQFTSSFRNKLEQDVLLMKECLLGSGWEVQIHHQSTDSMQQTEGQLDDPIHIKESGTTETKDTADAESKPVVAQPVLVHHLIVKLDTQGAYLRVHVHRQQNSQTGETRLPVTKKTLSSDDLSRLVLSTLPELILPGVKVIQVKEKQAKLVVQGGDWLAHDPALNLVQVGDWLTPRMEYFNREGVVQKVIEIPWTYLQVTKTDRGYAEAEIHSGLRVALGGKQRGKIETWAAKVKREFPHTTITLATQGQHSHELAGQKVYITDFIPELNDSDQEVDPATKIRTEFTNRWGELVLDADQQHPLKWITVQSGKSPLAKIPFIPGSKQQVRLEVLNDELRLQVEGELAILHSELINVMARRATMVATIRSLARSAKWDQVDQKLLEITQLPSVASILTKVAAIKVANIKLAKLQKNRRAELAIERLCQETQELVQRHLSADKIKVLEEEVQELKKLDRQDANLKN